MLVISCHADTGFSSHRLEKFGNGIILGHLDNFAGVYVVMQAYFSGKLNYEHLRIELTYDEEGDMDGAYEVRETLNRHDVVMVVDVTGVATQKDFTIEKCKNKKLQNGLHEILRGMSYQLYEGCEDPIATGDETDVYSEFCPYTFFLGLPCFGGEFDGNYNAGRVKMQEKTLASATQAIIAIVEQFPWLSSALNIQLI